VRGRWSGNEPRKNASTLLTSPTACLEAKPIVEPGGGQHAYDAKRDAFLASQGFRVVRFWNGDMVPVPVFAYQVSGEYAMLIT
jgi:hypothetical protein